MKRGMKEATWRSAAAHQRGADANVKTISGNGACNGGKREKTAAKAVAAMAYHRVVMAIMVKKAASRVASKRRRRSVISGNLGMKADVIVAAKMASGVYSSADQISRNGISIIIIS